MRDCSFEDGEKGTSHIRSYQCKGLTVEVESGQARLYQVISLAGPSPEWVEVDNSPYILPLSHSDLIDSMDSMALAVQTYELATGSFELRDALTRRVSNSTIQKKMISGRGIRRKAKVLPH